MYAKNGVEIDTSDDLIMQCLVCGAELDLDDDDDEECFNGCER